MPKSSYIAFNDDAFAAQLQAFKNAIGAYSAALGVTAAQVTAQAADADYFSYVLACQQLMRNGSLQWTGWKDLTRGGGDLPPSGPPGVPGFSAPRPPGAPRGGVRFPPPLEQIKRSPAHNGPIHAA